jgi:hypothetical protein
MRMNGIRIQTERKQQDRSVRPAEKRRRRARMMQVRGPIRPVPGAWATKDTAQGEKRLFNWQNQAILTSPGTPPGECRPRHQKTPIYRL